MRNRGKVDAREWWRERAGVIRAARKACAEGVESNDAKPLSGPTESAAALRGLAKRALSVRCEDLRRFHVRLGRGTLPILADTRKLRAYATEAAFWRNLQRLERKARLRDYLVGIGNQAAAFALGLI